MKYVLFLISSFLFHFLPSRAQHPYYYQLSADNGLPSSEIYRLLQDSFGYVWIGSDAGLLRYDGSNFSSYQHPEQNGKGISGLRFGNDGRLWCQNFAGQIFYVQYNALKLFTDLSGKARLYPEFSISPKQQVWIAFSDSLLCMDQKGNILYRKKSLPSSRFGSVEPDWNAHIWAVSNKEAVCIEPSFTSRIVNLPAALIGTKSSLIRGGDHRLYTFSEMSPAREYFISEITESGIQLRRRIAQHEMGSIIYTLRVFANGDIWLGTSEGAWLLDKDWKVKEHLFPQEKITDILYDREKNYWFSTLQNGIYIVPSLEVRRFTRNNSSLTDDNISFLGKDHDGALLIGTYLSGLFRYEPERGLISPLSKGQKTLSTRFAVDVNGSYLAARGSLSVINKTTEKQYSTPYIRNMIMLGDSLIFTSPEHTAVVHHIGKLLTENKFEQSILLPKASRVLAYDSSMKCLWIGTDEGTWIYSSKKTTLVLIRNKKLFSTCMYWSNGILWAGTMTEGVIGLEKGKPRYFFNEKNGLKGNYIRSILAYGNTLFVATDKCINRIDLSSRQFTYLDASDGLAEKEIYCMEVIGNTLFVGSNKSLLAVPLNFIPQNNKAPNICLMAIGINDQPGAWQDDIRLSHKQNNISFHFSSAAFRNRKGAQYYYRLLGMDSSWNCGSTPMVRYNTLPAGNYTFELKAANEDEIMSLPVYKKFQILPPYWQSWWFYVLLGASTIGLLYGIFSLRLRILKKQTENRHKLTLSQLTALKAQMNPHFMYNTLNSIQDLIVQNDIRSTNYYLSQFGSLMRKVLDASGNEHILLAEEIEILQLYLTLEKLRFGEQFSFSLQIGSDIDKESLYIPSMIIQPFVENAIKHGLLHKRGQKKLELSFSLENHTLLCRITDNGIGRSKAAEIKSRANTAHRSFATLATGKRLELINSGRSRKISLQISDLPPDEGKAGGTQVLISIPLNEYVGHEPDPTADEPIKEHTDT